mgnify:CR=1 FL=1
MKRYTKLTYLIVAIVFLFSGFVYGFFFSVDVEKVSQEAKEAYYDGNLKTAIQKYKKIVHQEPNSRANLHLAAIYEELGQYKKAAECYKDYLQYNPQDIGVRLEWAIAYYNLGQHDLARQELETVLESEVSSPTVKREAAYYLSKIELSKEDYNKSIAYTDKALKIDDQFALAMVLKGDIYNKMGKVEQSISSYQKALKLDGSIKGIHHRLGNLYLKKEKFDSAYYRYSRALRENKDDKLAKEKTDWLEDKFPDRFKKDSAPPEGKELPEKVKFKKISPLTDDQNIKKIRVGLSGGKAQKVVFFRVGSDFAVKNRKGEVLFNGKGGNNIWKAEKKSGHFTLSHYPEGKSINFKEPVTIEPAKYTPILIHKVLFGEGYYWSGKQDRQYRGKLELLPKEDGLSLVNIVNVEEYLYSVVTSEMPAYWPVEALKVQAVAARTYTYFNLEKHRSQGFDLCDTVHCAAYNGIGWEYSTTHKAVNGTTGQIMTYDGEPINAVYSANSGGHTENVEDVWGFETPYLKGVSTLKDNRDRSYPLAPADLKRELKEVPVSYSLSPRYSRPTLYRWERRVDRSFIEDRLDIGELKELKVTGRGKGGSVTAIKVVGTDGEKTLKSALRYNLGGLRSNRFFFRPEYRNGQLIAFMFYGGGWGHGVGMDQVASAGMAVDGISYDEILKHFYTDIEIEEKY